MKKIWIVLLVLMLTLAGCSPASSPDIEPAPVTETTAAPTQTTANLAPTNEVPENLLTLAKEDLAAKLGVDMDVITLHSAKPVEWSDSSLGCPEPDTMYAQVITPGYQIVLSVDEHLYSYHTDDNDQVRYCLNDTTLPVNPDDIQDGEPWVPVD